MDEYLSSRREYEETRPSFIDSLKERLKGIKLQRQREREDVYSDYDDGFDEDELQETQNSSQVDVGDEDYEEPVSTPRRSLISWLFRRRTRRFEEDEDFEEEIEVAQVESNEEEYREAIKILHKWLEKLDPDTLNRFKRSEDFEKYKSVLKKLNMIK